MFIGLVTCPYYGDTAMFMDGSYFTDEEALKTVFENSNINHYGLEVKELKKAPRMSDMPVHYALMLVGNDRNFPISWDDQGKSTGGMYVNVPQKVRDEAMITAKTTHPEHNFVWHETYQGF